LYTFINCAGGGCSLNKTQTPQATAYPATNQQKMQAGHHWDVLASYEASKIIASIEESVPLYLNLIDQGKKASPFSSAYHDLLTSQLVQSGASVITQANAQSITIRYKTQVLEHYDRGYQNPKPGTYTLLSAGLWLADQAIGNWSHSGAVIAPIALGADFFAGSIAKRSPTELLVTTQAVKGNQILMSDSSIYYLNMGDSGNYTNPKLMNVVNH